MSARGTIGGRIVLEGESQYRAALKNIKTEQAELRSEMQLCQSTFEGNQNSLGALEEKYGILTRQIDAQTRKVGVYQAALETSSKKEEEAAGKVDELKTALEAAEGAMAELEGSSDTTAEAIEEQAKKVEELKQKLALAEQSYDRAAQRTSAYQTSINYANADLQRMERELETTRQYMQEAQQSTDQCATSIDEYGRQTSEASEKTSVFGEVLKAELLSGAIKEGISRLAEGIKEAASAAADVGIAFEAAMSQVAATMGMTAEEVENGSDAYVLLSNSAKECGATTMFSASEAAEALNYLALAGYDAEKAAATLPKVLDLAAAGGLDLAYASDLVTDSMAAMGMETSQLDNYIDQMARTSQKSNTSIAQLGEATLVCAGTVSLTGQSLETMNTQLGILANNGIKGAEGGTHLRNVLLSLAAPTDKAAVTIENLGLQIEDSQGNMRDLNDIMIDLNSSLDGMSDVEKTKIINRIFNTTDIASVNALLKGTGKEYNNLYQEINNCSGAAANMAETLNNNLKGRLDELESGLEGLGISMYDVFDDHMKVAVEGATEAVGRLQKSVESGDMHVSLNKLSESLGEFCENAVDIGEDALPILIDGFTWILDNSDAIVSGIVGITTAATYHSKVVPAIEGVTEAWRAYKIANEGATVSQWLLNKAMNANPAGILVTAIVGLTAALGAYIVLNKDNLSVTDEVTQKTREQVEAAQKLNESYVASSAARTSGRQSLEAEAASCKKLVTELKDLQSKTTLTSTEQAKQKMIVDQLNQTMPELNLAIDEQTGKLNMSSDALEQNVEAMMAYAKAEAARADLVEIAAEELEAKKQLAELELQLKEQKNAVTEAQEKYNEAMAESIEAMGGQADSCGTMAAAEAEYLTSARQGQQELEAQIELTQEAIDGFAAEYEETLSYISDTEPLDSAAEATGTLGETAEATGERISGMSEKVAEAYETMYEDLSETITNQMNLFDEFNGKAELSTQELLTNMQSQIDGITAWSDNLQELADRGINQGLLQSLADMGPEGAGYVATFVQMTDEELQKANELFEESLTIPDEAVEKVAEAYVTAGEMAAQGYKEGIKEGAKEAAEASREMGKFSLNELEDIMEIKSPSRATKRTGENFDEGFIVGIKGKEPEVINTVANLAAEILRTSQNGLQTSKFINIGSQIPSGLIQGINSGKSGVTQAIVEMCTSAIEAAKRELDINSPSKKFDYMGEMSGEGYIGGWKRSMANIDAVIAASLPDTAMIEKKNEKFTAGQRMNGLNDTMREIYIPQEINIYGDVDNPIETARQFKQAQKEAAQGW